MAVESKSHQAVITPASLLALKNSGSPLISANRLGAEENRLSQFPLSDKKKSVVNSKTHAQQTVPIVASSQPNAELSGANNHPAVGRVAAEAEAVRKALTSLAAAREAELVAAREAEVAAVKAADLAAARLANAAKARQDVERAIANSGTTTTPQVEGIVYDSPEEPVSQVTTDQATSDQVTSGKAPSYTVSSDYTQNSNCKSVNTPITIPGGTDEKRMVVNININNADTTNVPVSGYGSGYSRFSLPLYFVAGCVLTYYGAPYVASAYNGVSTAFQWGRMPFDAASAASDWASSTATSVSETVTSTVGSVSETLTASAVSVSNSVPTGETLSNAATSASEAVAGMLAYAGSFLWNAAKSAPAQSSAAVDPALSPVATVATGTAMNMVNRTLEYYVEDSYLEVPRRYAAY